MTSVNELNGAERARKEGYERGCRQGRCQALEEAKKHGATVRTMKLIIAFVLGLSIASVAHAQTAQTSLEVHTTVTAEVACNPENCPTWEDIEAVSVEPEPTWWERMIEWMQKLIT